MASTSTQNIPGSSSNNSPALSDPTSHQRSKKKQQYEALLNAEVGTAFTSTSLGSPASHPSFPAVAPLCRQYPTQASAIFQTYLDLKNGAAAWDSVEPLVLSINPQSIPEAVVETVGKDLSSLSDEDAEKLVNDRLNDLRKGVTKLGLVNGGEGGEDMEDLTKVGVAAIKGRRKGATSYEIFVPLTISQRLRASQLRTIFDLIQSHAVSCSSAEQVDTSHLFLAVIAPDSTLVYYLLSQGMVKPVN